MILNFAFSQSSLTFQMEVYDLRLPFNKYRDSRKFIEHSNLVRRVPCVKAYFYFKLLFCSTCLFRYVADFVRQFHDLHKYSLHIRDWGFRSGILKAISRFPFPFAEFLIFIVYVWRELLLQNVADQIKRCFWCFWKRHINFNLK